MRRSRPESGDGREDSRRTLIRLFKALLEKSCMPIERTMTPYPYRRVDHFPDKGNQLAWKEFHKNTSSRSEMDSRFI